MLANWSDTISRATAYGAMLATALAIDTSDAGASPAAWRQIVDIVAQAGAALATAERGEALARAAALAPRVPVAERRMTAASIAARTTDPDLVALFAADLPVVAAPVVAQARLTADAWLGLVPIMPAAARNILRNRRDLAASVAALLARYAAGDLALAHAPGERADSAQAGGEISQIRELVERIEAFRARAAGGDAAIPPAPQPVPAPVTGFHFETTADGVIDWVEGVTREPLIGVTIAEPAVATGFGVDGGAAGAWRRRAPFSDARLSVAGTGAAGGDWLISAAPLFNPGDGRFWGYRGTARRPRLGEQARPVATPTPLTGTGLAPDSLRQLVHELRTPLNAVLGFSEMIDRQMLGPAAEPYRTRAAAIGREAERVLAVVDDLDTAARLDTGRLAVEPVDRVDGAHVLTAAVARQAPMLAERGVTLVLASAAGAASIAAAAPLVERLYVRLLTAVTATAGAGETIAVALTAEGTVALTVARSAALAGRDERALLDPSDSGTVDGEWPDAPLLGLGFTLRLVERLAEQCGGGLSIEDDRFVLSLPADRDAVDATPTLRAVGPAGFEPAT